MPRSLVKGWVTSISKVTASMPASAGRPLTSVVATRPPPWLSGMGAAGALPNAWVSVNSPKLPGWWEAANAKAASTLTAPKPYQLWKL